jgi:hypothetical protein
MDRIKNRGLRGGGRVMQRAAPQDHNTTLKHGLDGPDEILAVASADIPDIDRQSSRYSSSSCTRAPSRSPLMAN